MFFECISISFAIKAIEGVCFELNLTFAMERSLRIDEIKSTFLKVVRSP